MQLLAFDGSDRLRDADAAYRAAHGVDPGETPLWSERMRRNAAARRGVAIKAPDVEGWLVSAPARRGKQPVRTLEALLHDGRWLLATQAVGPEGWPPWLAATSARSARTAAPLGAIATRRTPTTLPTLPTGASPPGGSRRC